MRSVLLAVAILLAFAAPASAAPDRTAPVSASTPSYAWSPDPASGHYVTLSPIISYDPAACSKEPDTYCDMTLVHIDSETPVQLDITVTEFSDSSDFDLYVYESDASGRLGTEVEGGDGSATGGSFGADEIWTQTELAPGYYLVYVVYFYVDDDTFKGNIKVTGATGRAPDLSPPAPGPGPTASDTPLPFRAAGSIGSARKVKKSRRVTFRATADTDISGLSVRLVRPKGSTLGTVQVPYFRVGTRKLTIRLSKKTAKRMRAGTYRLIAAGDVNGELQSVTQAVKLKR